MAFKRIDETVQYSADDYRDAGFDAPPEAEAAPKKSHTEEKPAQEALRTKVTVEGISARLEDMRFDLEKVLPKQIPVDRFIRTTITAVTLNKDLLTADLNSLLESCMKAAQDGLLCDGREAALVCFNSKEKIQENNFTREIWVKKVQYMPMVKGLLKVIYQTGLVSSVSAHEVYAKDSFVYELGDDEKIIHKPFQGKDRGEIVAAYAIFKMRDGAIMREVMQAEDIEKIRNASKAKTGPWTEWKGEMTRKCPVRRGIKYLPTTQELERLLEHENETFDFKATPAGDKITPLNSAEDLTRLLEHTPVVTMPPVTATQKEKVPV